MIEFAVDGHVAVIRLDRVEARNAINGEMAEAIEGAIDRLEDDDDLWVGVLTHNGPVFCAGADLKEIAAGRGDRLATKRGGFGGIVLRERTKPLIAAVDGHAVAGGTEITLACDLVVASTASRFGIPEVKRSLVAAAGGLVRLPRVLPPKIAMELALTGDELDATRAHHFGLVNELCEAGRAVETALGLAARINANAPLAVRASRQLVLDAPGQTDREAMRAAQQAMAALSDTEDFAEGPRAFIEKRPAVWKGR
ncbi:MAG: crotonase/enoyl-CoA hydratase family protein [Actinobacteria bacterium]|nr:crotonase/enoyl-CoA hydratase family protein [Actinomycetota bacterium]NIS30202.1 crotonase/enoyl-CoA hydratase family protein [Actinomycetota bacterium]NIT94914.1 crotonase/enoyl-CoA hydratase family protein [Actinomycetota bacterium]NIU18583.1 crotonase/enoyl-CoA hydratase family protein [Actinomycetota bacterium]NIU65450.1 crotonase/enoyl-CoA hydratase family protein [Actinomycetota bacterium]